MAGGIIGTQKQSGPTLLDLLLLFPAEHLWPTSLRSSAVPAGLVAWSFGLWKMEAIESEGLLSPTSSPHNEATQRKTGRGGAQKGGRSILSPETNPPNA